MSGRRLRAHQNLLMRELALLLSNRVPDYRYLVLAVTVDESGKVDTDYGCAEDLRHAVDIVDYMCGREGVKDCKFAIIDAEEDELARRIVEIDKKIFAICTAIGNIRRLCTENKCPRREDAIRHLETVENILRQEEGRLLTEAYRRYSTRFEPYQNIMKYRSLRGIDH